MSVPRRRLKSLSLCGGLLKAATLVGCIKALEDADMLGEELVVVSGSSSGAVLAALVAIGWKADQIAYQLIEKTSVVGDLLESDPFALNIVQIIWTLWRNRCLDKGDRMYAFFDHLFGDITFAQVKARFNRDLIVTASCYSTQKLVLFNRFDTPNVPIKTALRASCSYAPLLLPVEIRGRVYVDGGLLCNLPLFYADRLFPETRDDALGFQFDFSERNDISYAWQAEKWPSIVEICLNIVSLFFYRISYLDRERTYEAARRIIRVPSEGHDNTDAETKRKTHSTKSLVALHTSKDTLRSMVEFGKKFMESTLLPQPVSCAESVTPQSPSPPAASESADLHPTTCAEYSAVEQNLSNVEA